jgi:hypothetical protein
LTRRNWFAITGGSALAQPAGPPPRVACILNAYFPNSHADVFIGRLLDGYRLNGKWHSPKLQAVSFYVDQFPFNDMAREQAAEYGIRICKSVSEAIDGVDGIAVIGEHGNYPRTPRGNFMYPRKRYFDEIVRNFESRGRVLPLLNDKYLAYDWADAKSMADRVRAMHIPFACGSTLPLSWQKPPLDLPPDPRFDELLAVSFSDLEEHAYHGIEALQSVAERRGETGVAAVRYMEGDEVYKISPKLLDAALARRVNPPPPPKVKTPETEPRPVGSGGLRLQGSAAQKAEAFQIRYRDGLQASVLNLNSKTRDYLVAAKLRNEARPRAACFYISLYVHSHWGFMVQAFENLVLTKKAAMPIERTLMSNGILLAGLESRRKGGTWIDTPELAFSYSWPR